MTNEQIDFPTYLDTLLEGRIKMPEDPPGTAKQPIYPGQRSFLEVVKRLSYELGQGDLAEEIRAERSGATGNQHIDISEVVDHIDQEGLRPNHAKIIGAALGLPKKEYEELQSHAAQHYEHKFGTARLLSEGDSAIADEDVEKALRKVVDEFNQERKDIGKKPVVLSKEGEAQPVVPPATVKAVPKLGFLPSLAATEIYHPKPDDDLGLFAVLNKEILRAAKKDKKRKDAKEKPPETLAELLQTIPEDSTQQLELALLCKTYPSILQACRNGSVIPSEDIIRGLVIRQKIEGDSFNALIKERETALSAIAAQDKKKAARMQALGNITPSVDDEKLIATLGGRNFIDNPVLNADEIRIFQELYRGSKNIQETVEKHFGKAFPRTPETEEEHRAEEQRAADAAAALKAEQERAAAEAAAALKAEQDRKAAEAAAAALKAEQERKAAEAAAAALKGEQDRKAAEAAAAALKAEQDRKAAEAAAAALKAEQDRKAAEAAAAALKAEQDRKAAAAAERQAEQKRNADAKEQLRIQQENAREEAAAQQARLVAANEAVRVREETIKQRQQEIAAAVLKPKAVPVKTADETEKASEPAQPAADAAQRPEKTPKPSKPKPIEVKSKAPVKASSKEIIFPEGKRGAALLAYALTNHMQFGGTVIENGLLEKLHELTDPDGSDNQFAEKLGLDGSQYGKWKRNQQKKPPLPMMNALAEKLGAETEEEKTEWRKFMLGIPQEINQERVNHCLEPGAEGAIDTVSRGYGHSVALAKFFDLLMKRHGLTERSQLARTIVKNDVDKARRLRVIIDNTAGLQENVAVDIASLPEEERNVSDGKSKKINDPDVLKAVIAFAFPDAKEDSPLHTAAMNFLGSDKYEATEAEISARKSAGMRHARANNPDWGSRSKTFVGNGRY